MIKGSDIIGRKASEPMKAIFVMCLIISASRFSCCFMPLLSTRAAISTELT